MRYFTRGWAAGELSDEESDRASEAYRTRLLEITPRLPPAMLRLISEVRLHDGIIEQVVWNPHTTRMRLVVVCGDMENGYVQAQLIYGGTMLGRCRRESLARAALSRETELLYDEVDIDDDGVLSHRLLFWPYDEVTIDFRAFDLVISPRSDRRVDLGGAFVEEGLEE